MNWLAAHITREGPGVPRNAPRKTGLALLADVVRREWWIGGQNAPGPRLPPSW